MDKPNILFIMSDQHARHVTGCYGDPLVRTPAIDGLAAQGVRFTNAYCPSPICVPSRMSTLTGQWPFQQDCWTLQDHLGTDRPTWAHSLGAAGYRPVLIGRMHSIGPDQFHGFAERYAGEPGPHWPGVPRQDLGVLAGTQGPNRLSLEKSGAGQSGYDASDRDVCDAACQWLGKQAEDRDRSEPFCLMVGFTLPHCPFVARQEDYDLYDGLVGLPEIPRPTPDNEHPYLAKWRSACDIEDPDEDDILRARTAYYGLVTRTDIYIGKVLEALTTTGLDQNTLVVYCSDHGEHLGRHGHWWKNTFYEESVGVPLIMSWPGRLPQGETRDNVVNLVDIGATFIDAAGAPRLPASNGRSLLSIASDPSAPWIDRTFSEYVTDQCAGFTGPESTRQRMIRDGRWKLIVIDSYRTILFDLENDPDELNDLGADPAYQTVRDALIGCVLSDWNPVEIARRVEAREAEKKILHAWADGTRPPLHFVRELGAEESWLNSRREQT